MSLLDALAPYVARKGGRPGSRGCELCGAPLESEHPHLADLDRRALACACRPCALLFARAPSAAGDQGATRARWRTVPDRHLADPHFALEDREWDALGIPVSMAFFLKSSTAGTWTAVYPSPAGPVESLLRLDAWAAIAGRTPLADTVEPDVEALLVTTAANYDREHTHACMLIPIHACYALVGHVRRRWRGLDGGDEARAAIAERLRALRDRCELVSRGGAS
jgi:hypothetical protein